jgi:enoyl-CoA hydratase/carnithine racemase
VTAQEPEFSLIRYQVSEHVATITLNDPDRLNAIGHGANNIIDQMVTALGLADLDNDVRCVVLTGAGRAFCTGGNMSDGGVRRDGEIPKTRTALDSYRFLTWWGDSCQQIRALRKPVIGAINGLCYAGGFILAAHCDLLIAEQNARFSLLETRFGGSGIDIFPFLVGPQWAKFIALTGEILTAQQAKEIGLVIEVASSDTFHERVYDLARRIAAMPADAVVLNRRLVNAAADAMGWSVIKELSRALDAVTGSVAPLARSADGRSFAELLRAGDWAGFRDARDAAFREPWLQAE